MKKRVIILLLAFAAIIAALSFSVAADTVINRDIEPNNSFANAALINLNQTYTGYCESYKDVDVYKFEITDYGIFTFYFGPSSNMETSQIYSGWNVSLLHSNRATILGGTYIKTVTNWGKICYAKGTYYVEVNPSYSNIPQGNYNLRIDFTKLDKQKNEIWAVDDINNSVKTYIENSRWYCGTIIGGNDKDDYVLKTSTYGYLSVKFKIDDSVPTDRIKNGWKITIYDNQGKTLKSYNTKISNSAIKIPYNGTVTITVTHNAYFNSDIPYFQKYHIGVLTYPAAKSFSNGEYNMTDPAVLNHKSAAESDWNWACYKFGHTWPTNSSVKKATPVSDGCVYKECTYCNQQEVSKIISAPAKYYTTSSSYAYSGREIKPSVTIIDGNGSTISTSNYSKTGYRNNIQPGTGYVDITFRGNYYEGTLSIPFTISGSNSRSTSTSSTTYKKSNTMTVTAKPLTVKHSKRKKQVFGAKKAFAVSSPVGRVTFKKIYGNNRIQVSRNGKVTVKKGLRKGSYPITVYVTAAGNSQYYSKTSTVTLWVYVK